VPQRRLDRRSRSLRDGIEGEIEAGTNRKERVERVENCSPSRFRCQRSRLLVIRPRFHVSYGNMKYYGGK
jgi:hypothetical protein